uniref:Uncharacterized protein n=1 Tax=Plectus sambesii TaxID=2011161 RepID=A0A914XN32_9BILA
MYPQQHQSSQSRHSRRATSSQLVRAHNDPVNHPVSYAGTQVNLYGSVPPSTGHFPYNNYSYPPMGYAQANGVQLGLVTEHMLRKLDESRLMTMSELMRRAYGIPQQSGPYVQEPLTPRQAIENYPPKAKDVSPGHGDWKGQIEHIFAHLMEIAQEDRSFRRNIGEPLLGEIVSADLDEANDYYKLTLTFSRPTE